MKSWLRVFVGIALATCFSLVAAHLRRIPDPIFEGRLASQWAQDLLSADHIVRNEAQAALKIMGEPAVPQLRLLLQKRNRPWEKSLLKLTSFLPVRYQPEDAVLCRLRAAEMAGLLRSKAHAAAPDLVECMAFDEKESEAERALLRIGEASVPDLCAALRHRNERVRMKAATLLREFRPFTRETITALIESARDQSSPVRKESCTTLGSAGARDPEVIAALVARAGDKTDMVRAAAIESLGRIGEGDKDVCTAVEHALRDPSVVVQLSAAKALWNLEHNANAVVPVLVEILQTSEGWQAAYALGTIGTNAAAAVPALACVLRSERVPRPYRTPPSAAFALGKIGAVAIPKLVPLLTDPDPRVRISALMAFDLMGQNGSEAIPAIIELLQDKETEVRHTAALTLASIGAEPGKIIAGLSDCLRAEDIFMRAAAAVALRRIAPEKDWVVLSE